MTSIRRDRSAVGQRACGAAQSVLFCTRGWAVSTFVGAGPRADAAVRLCVSWRLRRVVDLCVPRTAAGHATWPRAEPRATPRPRGSSPLNDLNQRSPRRAGRPGALECTPHQVWCGLLITAPGDDDVVFLISRNPCRVSAICSPSRCRSWRLPRPRRSSRRTTSTISSSSLARVSVEPFVPSERQLVLVQNSFLCAKALFATDALCALCVPAVCAAAFVKFLAPW